MAGSLASCDDLRKSKGHGRLPSNLAESCVRPLELEEAIDILRHFTSTFNRMPESVNLGSLLLRND